jgi:O-antigen ligase
MDPLLSPAHASRFNALALLATLLVLIATPVPVTVFIAIVMLYSLAYLIQHRRTLTLTRIDLVVIAAMLSYLTGRIGPFILDDFSARYLSAPLHVAASIPIYLMLRHASLHIDLHDYHRKLAWGAAIGAIGGGTLAAYQFVHLGVERADGFMFYLNFAYLACSLMLICLALLRYRTHRWILVAGVGGGLAAIVFTQTRGVLLAIPLLLALVLLLNIDRIGWRRLCYAVIVLIGFSVTSYLTVPIVQERVNFTIEEIGDIRAGRIEEAVSSGGRVQLWTAAIAAFNQRPSIGLTYPEREALIEEMVAEGELTEWMLGIKRGHAHSQYFEVLATGGLVGITMMGGYLLLPFLGFGFLRRRDPDNPFALTGVLFTSGFILYCLTEVALQKELIAAWYGYMQINLLVLALAWQARRSAADHST